MKRVFWLFMGLLAALVIIPFGIANRHFVPLTFDPMQRLSSVFSLELPLSLLLFSTFMVGLLVGGFTTWLNQGRWRQTARLRSREAHQWKSEATRLTRERDAGAEKILSSRSRAA